MKKHLISLVTGLGLGCATATPTTVVEEAFAYADGDIDTIGTGGLGWDATEGGWQTGNSLTAANHFGVQSGAAIYTGGSVGTYTEQNRTFAAALTSSQSETIAVSFTLLRPETQTGRGIGIYLTNSGNNEFFIGHHVNGGAGNGAVVGLATTMANNGYLQNFTTSPSTQSITATISYDGATTSIVLSDSDETVAAHTIPGTFTFDGISVAGYNGSTSTNGIDDILVTTTPTPDPWASTELFVALENGGGAETYALPISNIGLTQTLNITSVTATGTDSPDVSAITFPSTIAPGASDEIGFTFTPTFGSGNYGFELEVASDDTNAPSPLVIFVDMLVVDPSIEVDVASVDFGSLANNPGAQTSNVTISNAGSSEPLEVTALTLAGSSAFTITSAPALPFTIAPGADQVIEISFDPGSQPGTFSGTLTIVSDDFNNTEPIIDLSATTAVSSNLVAQFTFGTDSEVRDLTSSDASPGSVASDLGEIDLASGARQEFGGIITNATSTALNSIDGNADGWARRDAPNGTVDPLTQAPTDGYTFTITPGGGTTVDFTNEGWLNLDAGVFTTVGGTSAFDFYLSVDDGTNPVFVLGPVSGPSVSTNTEATANLSFDVSSLGTKTTPVTFTLMPKTTGNTNGVSSQAAGFVDNITLSAEETIPLNPSLVVNATNDFLNEGLADSYSVSVSNSGAAELTITSVTGDGSGDASAFTNITFDGTIAAAGGTGLINFDFTPAGPGVATTNFVITSNDPNSPTTVAVSVNVLDPEILVDTTPLDFGTSLPSPGQQTLTISVTNDGEDNDLEINGTNLTGAGAAAFSILSTPAPIAPGNSDDIVVAFDPGATEGQFIAAVEILSNDSGGATPSVDLFGLVEPTIPSGVVVARFDFDAPIEIADNPLVDADSSLGSPWITSGLIDQATGTGALAGSNQGPDNRGIYTGSTGNYLGFSANRESDGQTPILAGGNSESTWVRFSVAPEAGTGLIDFSGGTASFDAYTFNILGGTVSVDWTLYYSMDGGSSWTALTTQAGTASAGGTATVPLSWDLTSIGSRTTAVDFALDPVSTGSTNGSDGQRHVGVDNLIITAGSVGMVAPGFDTWASTNSVANDPDGDTDLDGIPELLEYALGLDPNVPDGSPGTLSNGVLSFNKGTEAAAAGDLIYSIETSSDLGVTDPWAPVTPDINDSTEISYTLPAGEDRIFSRLNVVQAP
ncbi:beta strand repeat-containing protein [Haloferula rosea]|uniref:Choice-of-anchor D domain-containing protein n=1 Tax=Haloferula rosea TaxID=490093 RepID=A0A934VEE5_9BACT|nr:choice-of-anchor D domain-containing protein [Haloferula rosea]MBK1825961.1 choice-of-anchor D domain-containing protein [Haloferula rosea]